MNVFVVLYERPDLNFRTADVFAYRAEAIAVANALAKAIDGVSKHSKNAENGSVFFFQPSGSKGPCLSVIERPLKGRLRLLVD